MIRPVLLLICAAGAVLSARDAALAWRRGEALATLARGEPVRADGHWLGTDPQISLIAANAALQLNPAANQPGADAAARASLARDPLDPAALYVLAVMGERRQPGTALPIFQLIERLSRREVGAELALERAAAARGDAGAALTHLDRILSTAPDLAPPLLQAIAPTTADTQLRQRFISYAARPWFPQLIAQVIDAGQPIEAATVLLAAGARFQPPAALEDLRSKLFSRATELNDTAGLSILLNGLPAARQHAAVQFAPTSATADPGLYVLRWSLASDEVVNARLDPPAGLAISIASDRTAAAARRITLLPPGHYRLSHQLSHEAGTARPGLAWDMICGDPATGQIHQLVSAPAGTTRWQAEMIIGPGCSIQRWTLTATGDSSQAGSNATLSDIRLERLP